MAFKMKAGPGGPMKKNFPSAFKDDGERSWKDDLAYKWGRFKEELGETFRTGKAAGTRMDENVSAGIRRQNLIQARRDAQKNEENVAKGTAQGPQLPSSEEKKKVPYTKKRKY